MESSSNKNDHYNHGGMIAFLFSMVFVFVFFIYIVAMQKVDLGEGLQDPPTSEQMAKANVDISGITEPWVPNDDMVTHGAKVYSQNCAMCHGDTGLGDGAAGAALNPKPRNLVKGEWKKGGGYLGIFDVLTHGLPGTSMAAYGHLKVADRWALTQFVNSITEHKVEEDSDKIAEFAKTAE